MPKRSKQNNQNRRPSPPSQEALHPSPQDVEFAEEPGMLQQQQRRQQRQPMPQQRRRRPTESDNGQFGFE